MNKDIETCFKSSPLDFLGIVDLKKEDTFKHYLDFIEKKKHGEMAYLENNLETREYPQKVFKAAKSGIIFALNYYAGDSLGKYKSRKLSIAQYAQIPNYHKLMKKEAEKVCKNLNLKFPEASFKICIDTVPILEKALAARTLKGFIGKNTLYIHPDKGSYLLLGEIICDISLKADQKENVDPNSRSKLGGCGSCKRCQVYCPTNALSKDYKIDGKKCLAYLSIEHRSPNSY